MKKEIIIQLEHLEELVKEVQEVKAMLHQGNPPKDIPELLRTSEVKRLLKVQDSSLATLRQNGTLPFTKIGGTIYFLKTDIMDLLKNNYSGTDGKNF